MYIHVYIVLYTYIYISWTWTIIKLGQSPCRIRLEATSIRSAGRTVLGLEGVDFLQRLLRDRAHHHRILQARGGEGPADVREVLRQEVLGYIILYYSRLYYNIIYYILIILNFTTVLYSTRLY